jgi:hypothetical protein
MRNTVRWLGLTMCVSTLGACPRMEHDSLSASEAQEALEESSISSQAETLLADGVEISTNFTIGGAVEKAAQELREFIESQLPCAEVTLDDATLTVVYGEKSGACTFNGHTFSGSHEITVMRNDDEVLVHHAWDGFNNGKISVTGEADVVWSRASKSRQVMHELTWTVLTGPHAGRIGVGSGDRTQTALAGGIREGIRIDGTRAWEGDSGRFELEIDGVEARWSDPVPQAGSYELQAPSGKTLTLSFSRVDDDTIEVTVRSGSRSFAFNVSKLGAVTRSSGGSAVSGG